MDEVINAVSMLIGFWFIGYWMNTVLDAALKILGH